MTRARRPLHPRSAGLPGCLQTSATMWRRDATKRKRGLCAYVLRRGVCDTGERRPSDAGWSVVRGLLTVLCVFHTPPLVMAAPRKTALLLRRAPTSAQPVPFKTREVQKFARIRRSSHDMAEAHAKAFRGFWTRRSNRRVKLPLPRPLQSAHCTRSDRPDTFKSSKTRSSFGFTFNVSTSFQEKDGVDGP